MKEIAPKRRIVRNILKDSFAPLINEADGKQDGEVLHANPHEKPGYGFHAYRVPAGHTTVDHVHDGHEEFLLLEGELIDHDGFKYEKGDLVWLEAGTEHNSYSPNGALLAVFFR